MDNLLEKPLNWCLITQPFGVNWIGKGMYKSVGLPLDLHNGTDFALPREDKTVKATHNGEITVAKFEKGFGNFVELTDESGLFKTRYAHGEKLLVSRTNHVKVGQPLIIGGSTGFSTGPHLHFDFKHLNRDGSIKNYNNGYYGAVDPAPYFGKGLENLPVDERYGEKRTWKKWLLENKVLPELIYKLKRLPTHREIIMAVYGYWSFEELNSESFRTMTNWLTKPAYQNNEKPYIRQILG